MKRQQSRLDNDTAQRAHARQRNAPTPVGSAGSFPLAQEGVRPTPAQVVQLQGLVGNGATIRRLALVQRMDPSEEYSSSSSGSASTTSSSSSTQSASSSQSSSSSARSSSTATGASSASEQSTGSSTGTHSTDTSYSASSSEQSSSSLEQSSTGTQSSSSTTTRSSSSSSSSSTAPPPPRKPVPVGKGGRSQPKTKKERLKEFGLAVGKAAGSTFSTIRAMAGNLRSLVGEEEKEETAELDNEAADVKFAEVETMGQEVDATGLQVQETAKEGGWWTGFVENLPLIGNIVMLAKNLLETATAGSRYQALVRVEEDSDSEAEDIRGAVTYALRKLRNKFWNALGNVLRRLVKTVTALVDFFSGGVAKIATAGVDLAVDAIHLVRKLVQGINKAIKIARGRAGKERLASADAIVQHARSGNGTAARLIMELKPFSSLGKARETARLEAKLAVKKHAASHKAILSAMESKDSAELMRNLQQLTDAETDAIVEIVAEALVST